KGLLLSPVELTALWIERFNYPKYNFPPNNRNDLPRVSRFVQLVQKRAAIARHLLNEWRTDLLSREKEETRRRDENVGTTLPQLIARFAERQFDRDPEDPHMILAELPVSTYLTTNFDGIMAAAL